MTDTDHYSPVTVDRLEKVDSCLVTLNLKPSLHVNTNEEDLDGLLDMYVDDWYLV